MTGENAAYAIQTPSVVDEMYERFLRTGEWPGGDE
jgi:hypothetical protein